MTGRNSHTALPANCRHYWAESRRPDKWPVAVAGPGGGGTGSGEGAGGGSGAGAASGDGGGVAAWWKGGGVGGRAAALVEGRWK